MSESRAAVAFAGAVALIAGTTIRTVARAPRLRRNGWGPLERWGGWDDTDGGASAFTGGCVEIRVAPADRTAGNPTIVFLRGGLEDQGFFTSDAGGGVTIGDVGSGVLMTRPGATGGNVCDESRLGRPPAGCVR